MKLTPNELRRIEEECIMKIVYNGIITDRESRIYSYLRSYAFYNNTKKKRNLCKLQARTIAEKFGVFPNKIETKLKKLERVGLIKPKYYVIVSGKKKGYFNLKYVQANFGVRNVKFIEYVIFDLPEEKDKIKESKLKKKNTS